ncbi:unnamed protein product [Heligmosomoides polygyrus]|uniref:Conserved oligomeric Golgi complex subunit 6 n=1 Tax=Heligmosomoides polygyrus TaxID=6339 RepID=A0A3P8AXI2_HELPZ|nr:unnamed protein product [Heligmosomoides polygyrus]
MEVAVDDAAAAAAPPGAAVADSAASVTNPIKRRIDKLVASKLHNDPEFLKVVEYVAPMVDSLNIHTERRLLRSLEKRHLELNKEYLQEFEKVNAHVQDFAEKVRTMHRICSDLTNRIQQNKEKTQDLLSKTSALQNQKKHLESKQKAIEDFLGRFSLTEQEKRALEGSTTDGTVSSDFFPALARARDIYVDSKELLRNSGEHSAAVEIMEEMSQTLEKAYEVLYRSIQRECRILSADYVEMKAVLCQSFAALQEREVLLKYALDEVVTARKNQILRLYIDALTKGTYSNGKPIELMNTWVICWHGYMKHWRVNANFCKCCLKNAVLKLRVEQALAGETDSVVLYRLSALFMFYTEKMTPEIGADSELSRTIEELNQLTLNIFYSGLNGSVQKILSKMGAPDYDLLPVPAVHQILMLLRDVLETHDGSMASRQNAEEEFNKIFSCVLDPLYRSVQMEGNEDVLVSEEASAILANTGLINLYQKSAAHDRNQGPLSAISGMDANAVNRTLSQFDAFLAQPDKYQLDQVAKISSARTRESVHQRTMENVLAAYSVVVRKVEDPFNAYENVAFKSIDQVCMVIKMVETSTAFTLRVQRIYEKNF